MSVKYLYRRSCFINLAALSVLTIAASGQEALKNATTKHNGLAVGPNNQNSTIKRNASFATNFRNKGNTQSSRARVSCAKEIDLANSK